MIISLLSELTFHYIIKKIPAQKIYFYHLDVFLSCRMLEGDIQRISWQILQGVDYCHRNGVSESCDLSCDNYYLSCDVR